MLSRSTALKRSPFSTANRKPMSRGTQMKKQARRKKSGDDKRMRDACRGQPCWMRIPGVCCGRDDTVVPAHRNQGKGMGLKVADVFTVPACQDCHAEYDQGNRFLREEKRSMWDETYSRWSAYRDRDVPVAA